MNQLETLNLEYIQLQIPGWGMAQEVEQAYVMTLLEHFSVTQNIQADQEKNHPMMMTIPEVLQRDTLENPHLETDTKPFSDNNNLK